MEESASKNEKPQKQRKFDPELLKKGLRCDLDQYEMLKRCWEKKDMTKWNEWRKKHFGKEIELEGGDFSHLYLKGIELYWGHPRDPKRHVIRLGYFGKVYLKGTGFTASNLQDASFSLADLEDASFVDARLEGAHFEKCNLKKASFLHATVDGSSLFWECEVNKYRRKGDFTDFSGVALNAARIDPAMKQLLQYNIRRMNWENWYPKHPLLRWPVRLFWAMSDYGLSTWRIIATFFGLAIAFGVVYWLWPICVLVNDVVGDIRGFWHALYFSVVTMTTLGFGDIAANPDSFWGQTLLMVQVILGYVLLGALVTRFAVLFTAGGPAGKFADEKRKKDEAEKRTKQKGV